MQRSPLEAFTSSATTQVIVRGQNGSVWWLTPREARKLADELNRAADGVDPDEREVPKPSP